jgi:hypothetical protein
MQVQPTDEKIALIASGVPACNRIFFKSNGDIWVGGNNGLYILDKNTLKHNSLIPKISVRDIGEDAGHNV